MPGVHDEIQHLRGLLAIAATGTETKAADLPMEADKAKEVAQARVRRAESRHIVQRLSAADSASRVDTFGRSELESEEAGVTDSYSVLASAPVVRKQARRAVAVNIAAPPAYHSPSLAANLPAVLAAGYDLAFPSAARETVSSGKGARRVALFSQTWPVVVERLLFPALAKEAFLVAMIKNPSKQALPGGRANLFVGDDPAGIADLKFVAPGEMFTLPLGIDQAIKPIRNVTQSTIETGLISKDEVTEYTTVIEFANPYSSPLAARVKDQIPVTADKDRAAVKLLGSDPAAKLDPDNGALEWRMTVAPGATVKLKFIYSIKRPKGSKMVQQ